MILHGWNDVWVRILCIPNSVQANLLVPDEQTAKFRQFQTILINLTSPTWISPRARQSTKRRFSLTMSFYVLCFIPKSFQISCSKSSLDTLYRETCATPATTTLRPRWFALLRFPCFRDWKYVCVEWGTDTWFHQVASDQPTDYCV